MALPDVRQLAAIDMWGSSGSMRRRRRIRMEFFVGTVGCMTLGLYGLARGSGWIVVVGAWLVGVGMNYVPLAAHAQSLSRPGALERELEGVDTRRELRRAGMRQLWIVVPLAVAMAAVAQLRRRPGT